MKNVDVMQVRAMLREILATDGGTSEDVSAVMTIGTPAMGSLHLTGPSELRSVLEAVEQASPASEGAMRIEEQDWQRLELVYAERVLGPLFA